MQISKSNIDFLKQLSKNNNRDWFQANKATAYQSALENTIAFADCLLSEMKKHDNIETVTGKKSLYRIYKDIRFSKTKHPTKRTGVDILKSNQPLKRWLLFSYTAR